jgi:hypothetical protein
VKRTWPFVFSLAAALGCQLPIRSGHLEAEVVSYGRYEAPTAGTFKKSPPKVYRVVTPVLLEQTTEIPCRKGERFGVSYRVLDDAGRSASVRISIEWTHPSIYEPRDRIRGTQTQHFKRIHIENGASPIQFSGWGFSQISDLANGTWTLRLGYQGHTFLSRSFEVSGCYFDLAAALSDEVLQLSARSVMRRRD